MPPTTPVRITRENRVAQITDDGELWTTQTERETDVFAVYVEDAIAASKYVLMVDNDGALWPHIKQQQELGRIDITKLFVTIDAAVNGNGRFRLGVITRIDAVNADIRYFLDFPFLATTTQLTLQFSGTPSQVKTDFENGLLSHGITNSYETNVAGLNTGTGLDSPDGSVAPGLGDIVLKLEQSAGNYNVFAFMFYHSHAVD